MKNGDLVTFMTTIRVVEQRSQQSLHLNQLCFRDQSHDAKIERTHASRKAQNSAAILPAIILDIGSSKLGGCNERTDCSRTRDFFHGAIFS